MNYAKAITAFEIQQVKGADMANAIDVAAYVLEQVGNVTTMKLQKLVYYAQVRHLVQTKEPLFQNRIEAWANGPVIPDLFRLHAGKYMIGRSELGKFGSSDVLSDSERAATQKSVGLFRAYSGEKLRELTHNEAPWADARKGVKDGERCSNQITDDVILKYYTSPDCSNPIVR